MNQREESNGVVDFASRDIRGAMKIGHNAARGAKTIGKAAAMAASQNYAGTAVTLLKDPETLKKILVIALIPLLLFTMLAVLFLYALPTMIFEAVVSYFDVVAERWQETTYAGGGNVFWNGVWATIKTGGEIIGDIAQGLWDSLKSLFTTGSGEDTGAAQDPLSDNGMELQVIQDGPNYLEALVDANALKQGAEYYTLLRKVDACVEKINVREQAIQSAINAQSGAIQDAVNARYASSYDHFNTTVRVTTEPMSQSGAIQLLGLYTVQTNASLQEIRLSSLMKWLGWNGGGGTTSFSLADYGVSCSVNAWKGEFLPQYLLEQELQEKHLSGSNTTYTDFSEYRCPAVDLVIVVDCPDLADIPISVSTVNVSQGVTDEDGEPVMDEETGEQVTEVTQETVATAAVNISVRTRGVTSLAQLAGLWDGPLSQEQTGDFTIPDELPFLSPGGTVGTGGETFAFWLRNHIDGSGSIDSEARQMLFGSAAKGYFSSAAEAAPYLKNISIPVWDIDAAGNRYSTTRYLQVHYLVADEIQSIFQQIYEDPERFPIKSIGGARFTDTMRHSWGCAIDINPYENCECNFRSGSLRVTCGSGWWPSGLNGQNWVGRPASAYHGSLSRASAYSIAPGGSVVRAFAAHGWGWGGNGWSHGTGFDFMHFSVLPSGG